MQINGHKWTRPLVQGGMGIGISLDRLAGAVAAEGGIGVISSAYAGLHESGFEQDRRRVSLESLPNIIRQARERAGDSGLIGINIMCAVSDYSAQVAAALRGGVDVIISGAGLPKELPAMVGEASVLLVPIVSGGRVASLLCRYWQRRHQRLPDAVVLEGPAAGGHLGFSMEELQADPPATVKALLADVKEALAPYEAEAGREIPVIVGGGITTRDQVQELLRAGAKGVQLGTRFIATEECDASMTFKQAIVSAKPEDVRLVKSPVGMPGRALNSPLIEAMARGERRPPERCFDCLTPCDPATTPYCISQALVAACRGDWDHGLFFCGREVGQVNRLIRVKELFDELLGPEENL